MINKQKKQSFFIKIIFLVNKKLYFDPYTSMKSYMSSFLYQKGPKDSQITTNTCSTQSNCVKNIMGKFFRKPDSGKIQKKKKVIQQQKSLLCYLTPKNCEQGNKIMKERMKQCKSEVNINSFLGNSQGELLNYSAVNKPLTRNGFGSKILSRQTSLQKCEINKKEDNKIIINLNKKQSAEQYQVKRIDIKNDKLIKNSPLKNQKLIKTSHIEEKSCKILGVSENSQIINKNSQKEVKKLKNQCEYYSNLLQESKRQKQQVEIKNKEMCSQIKNFIILLPNLQKLQTTSFKYLNEIKQKIIKCFVENQKLLKRNNDLQDQRQKMQDQILYLKDNIEDLNERINQLVADKLDENMRDNQKKTNHSNIVNHCNMVNLITSTLKPTKRFSAIQSTSRIFNSRQNQSQKQPFLNEQSQKKLINQLKNQLKYCQVQINMLKRVKLDVNKKNQEFIKLQRQNKILKNQIFQMKTSNAIQQQMAKPTSTKRLSQQNLVNRNNFQIGLQRGSRARQNEKRMDSCSSDTLSLNLSLSPEKERRRV